MSLEWAALRLPERGISLCTMGNHKGCPYTPSLHQQHSHHAVIFVFEDVAVEHAQALHVLAY